MVLLPGPLPESHIIFILERSVQGFSLIVSIEFGQRIIHSERLLVGR